MRILQSRTVVWILLSTSSSTAFAETFDVCASGCDFDTVQQAVDGAATDDTIVLSGETFNENVMIDIALTLQGQDGAKITATSGAALSLTCLAPPCTTVIDNIELEVTGSDVRGMQIDDDINATFRDLVIRGGHATGEGGGILCRDATLFIEDSVFEGNTAATGGGLLLDVDCAATLTRTHFEDNTATDGGHIYARGDVTSFDSTFVGGSADSGAAFTITGADSEVRRTLFCDNDSTSGEPVVASGGTHVWTNNVLVDHTAPVPGVVAFSGGADASFINNTLLDNDIRGLSGADATLDVRNNLVARGASGAGVTQSGQTTSFDYNSWYQLAAGPLEDQIGTGDIGANSLVDVNPVLRYDDTRTDCSVERALVLASSPVIDAGDPSLSDLDGTRSDIGAFGGPAAAPAWWTDGDGDSGPWVYDCDDTDVSLGIAAPDICDGIDNDCDGDVDADDSNAVLTRLYQDADGDGFGTTDDDIANRWDCPPVAGWVENDEDCHDGAPTAFPGGTEVCDLLDNDCNGVLDDGFETFSYYIDQDGDSFGRETPLSSPRSPLERCMQPPDYVLDNTDCDDSSANAYPGNDFFDPYDGFDNQCTGALEFDGDEDGYARDTNGGEDCDDQDPNIHPGVEDIPNDGINQDCQDGPLQVELTGGCACSASGAGSSGGMLPLAALLLGLGRRRRV